MNDTAKHPIDLEPLRTALATINREDLLTDYVGRESIGVRYREIS